MDVDLLFILTKRCSFHPIPSKKTKTQNMSIEEWKQLFSGYLLSEG